MYTDREDDPFVSGRTIVADITNESSNIISGNVYVQLELPYLDRVQVQHMVKIVDDVHGVRVVPTYWFGPEVFYGYDMTKIDEELEYIHKNRVRK